MSAPRRRAARGVRRRGFSLPELLVTLTLLALIGTAVTRVMVTQLRFWTRTREAGAVQRNLRTGLALLPQDLRAASRLGGGTSDLRQLTDSSIELAATIGSAVACARANARQLDLPPRNLANNTLTAWFTPPKAGDLVWIYDESTGPAAAQWLTYTVAGLDSTSATGTGCAPYVDPAKETPAAKPRWRLTLGADLPGTVGAGAPMRFGRPVRYSLYQPAGASRWYLGYKEYAGGAWTAPEPVAGPFQRYAAAGDLAASGVSFQYFDSTGTRLADPVAPGLVSRVDLVLRAATQIRGGPAPVVARDSVAVRVAIRNRW